MKIVLFGLGKHYQNNKHHFLKLDVEIVVATDNNSSLWGQAIDGIEIESPENAIKQDYDYIVITNVKYERDIHEQLLEYNVSEEKIVSCNDFIRSMNKGKLEVYFPLNQVSANEGKILFMMSEIGYHGGAMAILYAAMASIQNGYSSTILCAYADSKLLEVYRKKGIEFWIYPNLMCATKDELWWVPDNFSKIIANTLTMGNCVVYLKEKAPMIWWIHETLDAYEIYAEYWKECNWKSLEGISVYAVTEQAKRNFQKHFRRIYVDTLLLGIPDEKKEISRKNKSSNKMIFAVIGGVENRKGQDIFLEAVEKIPENIDAEFWVIGKIPDTEFAKQFLENAKDKKNIKILGMRTREEMQQLYQMIDVMVVCSREETLSIVAIEGMINKKTCIVSDLCGVSEYLENTVNAIMFHSEDSNELAELLLGCCQQKFDLEKIGINARVVYDEHFSMSAFADRIQKILN